jgi:mannose-6-phosphate isomerase-like protein (cupin superfamily)
MLKPIRRVVTGLNAAGRSVVLSDETVSSAFEVPQWPGRGVTAVWSLDRSPASNLDTDLPSPVTSFPKAGSGGMSLMIMHIPPESELQSMPPEQRAKLTIPVAHTFPEAMDIDTSKSYQMHATDTADLLVMLSGELTLIMDEGEVTLKPFDTVIQRGVNHGWINRGKEPVLIAAAVVDARQLDRKLKPKAKPKAGQMW